MEHDGTESDPRLTARREFAARLRQLRLDKGFRTARSLAKVLSIDENRYTRYERAEVEPDLGLIRRICDTLSVTPNELLAYCPPIRTNPATGALEVDRRLLDSKLPHVVRFRASSIEAQCWKLACLVAAIQASADPAPEAPAQGGRERAVSLANLEIALRTFEALRTDPFRAIARIVRDDQVRGATPAQAAEVDALGRRITELATKDGGRQQRGRPR